MAICTTCDGRGLIGGFVSADSGYQDDPCPDCSPVRTRKRIVTEKGCPACAELARGSFGPSHDPSPRCESGKRPHCTCDVCF
jgi:hypothetical protein